ncbi:MAG TPA: ribonuclease HII [Candidatus Margulisbacteria bacterium]|nr:MAG: ribonuclease HII [Candidatus Margulisbacteria bacterium GWD2_39_127]OGI01564.1 MAG: ribonuclease HII [Candidatus Margulisbacteria bacterium GWF2_38_17]OGI10005.1 MAG: ribonuclease HII [Candidatus Margulisbacteria bacterium GWE2_39_32]HAR61852.1 ribonuclease HII [Candidatus Margulisiibacteriota bacterium]HCT84222.1 ribonuclease HII [Candidatus Margulisiibacteriota bacterium]
MARQSAVNTAIEYQLRIQGYIQVAGVDEAGRGSMAGPVVAAAVILPINIDIPHLNDSKQLKPQKRNVLFDEINKKATAIGIGIVCHKLIDKHNILQATFMAMKKALERLPFKPNYVIVDGNRTIPDLTIKQQAIVGGDGQSASIAAASIIAKVTRDRIMDNMHNRYPQYDFLSNKGYGTAAHQEVIFTQGLSPIHRKSFQIKKQLKLF